MILKASEVTVCKTKWRNVSSSLRSDQSLHPSFQQCTHVEHFTFISDPFSFTLVFQNRRHSVFITDTDSRDHRPQCVILGLSRDALYCKMMKMKTKRESWRLLAVTWCPRSSVCIMGLPARTACWPTAMWLAWLPARLKFLVYCGRNVLTKFENKFKKPTIRFLNIFPNLLA